MRRLALPFALLAGSLALAACSDGTDPADVPALGRYAYTATVPTQTIGGSMAVTATLTLTYATPDSIAGQWTSTYYENWPAKLGVRNADAWVLTADGRAGSGIVLVTHRLTGSGPALGCEGRHLTGTTSVPFACTLTYVGP